MDVDDDQDDGVSKVSTRRATIVNKKRAIVVKRPVPKESKKGRCSDLFIETRSTNVRAFPSQKAGSITPSPPIMLESCLLQ